MGANTPGNKVGVVQLLTAETSAPTASDTIHPWNGRLTFFATGTTSGGAGTATVLVEASLDNTTFVLLGTLTLSWTNPTVGADGIAIDAPWRYIRMRLTAITGTAASVDGWMGG